MKPSDSAAATCGNALLVSELGAFLRCSSAANPNLPPHQEPVKCNGVQHLLGCRSESSVVVRKLAVVSFSWRGVMAAALR